LLSGIEGSGMGGNRVRKLICTIFILLILSGCDVSDTVDKDDEYPIRYTYEGVQPDCEEKSNANNTMQVVETDLYDTIMRRDLLCLMMAYPGFVSDVERGRNGDVYVVMNSGKKILYDDKEQKTYEQKLSNTDLQDTMELLYPLSDISELMEENYDPGRIRSYALLKEVYGASRQQIEKNLKGVRINGQVCSFNGSNGAAEALGLAVKEIIGLTKSKNTIYSSVFPVNGTYNYRVISGTNQLSPHAFGIAIDFKSDKRDYWKWASTELGQQRLNEYPREVVRALEDMNFIWGGKWAHFDILHFEYRPEIVIKSRYFVEEFEIGGSWYYGFPYDDEAVKSYIDVINEI